MSKDELIELVNSGREIEFVFDKKRFSITYGTIDNRELISFCEFYRPSTQVYSVDELLKVERYGVTVETMMASIDKNDIWIF